MFKSVQGTVAGKKNVLGRTLAAFHLGSPDPGTDRANVTDSRHRFRSRVDVPATRGAGPSADPTGWARCRWSTRLASAGRGPNRLPDKPPRSAWLVLLAQLKGFLNLLLLIAAALAWAVSDLKDALMIGAVTVFNAILGFLQEHRAERALMALKHMVAFRARVRRDGRVAEVAADGPGPGRHRVLEAGDRVPADGRLFVTQSFEVDESGLTGESLPVRKRAEPDHPADHPAGRTDERRLHELRGDAGQGGDGGLVHGPLDGDGSHRHHAADDRLGSPRRCRSSFIISPSGSLSSR